MNPYILLLGGMILSLLFAMHVIFAEQINQYAHTGRARRSLFFKARYCRVSAFILGGFLEPKRHAVYKDYLRILCASVALARDDRARFLSYLQRVKHMKREKDFWLALYHMAVCHDPVAAEPYLSSPSAPTQVALMRGISEFDVTGISPCEKSRGKLLKGVYYLETGKGDEGWALLEERYPYLRFDACKRVLKQYADQYADKEAGEKQIPPLIKSVEFSETLLQVREALIREYPLTEKLDCDLECFRLDKRRCVVFWGAPVWNNSAALHLMYDKLRAETQSTDLPYNRHITVIAESKDEFHHWLHYWDKDGLSRPSGMAVTLYLIDRDEQRIQMHADLPLVARNPKKHIIKMDGIIRKTLFE